MDEIEMISEIIRARKSGERRESIRGRLGITNWRYYDLFRKNGMPVPKPDFAYTSMTQGEFDLAVEMRRNGRTWKDISVALDAGETEIEWRRVASRVLWKMKKMGVE